MSATEDIQPADDRAAGDERLRQKLARTALQLQEAEERFARLLALIPDALVLIDEEDHIRYVNDEAVRLVGARDAEAVLGRSVFEFVAADDVVQARLADERVRHEDEPRQGRLRIVQESGRTVPVEAAAVRVPFQGRDAVLSRAHDLRQRQRIEQALSQTEDLFRKVFEASPASITLSRLDDGTILAANEAAQRMSGFARDEFVGQRLARHWVHQEQREEIIRRVKGGEVVENAEVQIVAKDGTRKFFQGSFQQIELKGEPCLLAVVLNVTEQRKAEAALGERDAVLRAFYDTVPVMMGVVELHGEDIFHVSDSAATAEFFGSTPEQLRNRYASELGAPPEVIRMWIDAYRESKATGAPVRLEYLHEWERGKNWLSATVAHIQTLASGVDRYSYVIADVTDRKASEQELLAAKERAEDIARLRTAILNNITHEVRTPLTVILGFTSMLRQGVRPKFVRFVNLIERSGRRLMLMLDTILDLAQLEVGTLEVNPMPVDAVELVENAVTTLRPQAEAKGLELAFEAGEVSISARLDQRVLTRVLHNLLDNAIKFTEAGRVLVELEATDAEVIVRVHDTGIGIDTLYLTQIFEEFSQESTGLERTYQGSGLGLAVSKRLVELVGGTIAVESRKGEGSVFCVTMPRYMT